MSDVIQMDDAPTGAGNVTGNDAMDARGEAIVESLESAAFLQRILDASADCIKVLTPDGRLVFMNSGGRRVMEVDDVDTV